MRLWKLCAFFAALLFVPCGTFAQTIASTGNELQVSYGGYTAVVLQNSPVNPTLLSGSGTNEFILGISQNPNVTAQVYITNETANACSNLTISFASSANAQINSFNQFPQSWSTVPLTVPPSPSLFGSGGTLANSYSLVLGANQTVTISTLPIKGNKLVIFLPLSSGCATTNIDLFVVLSTPIQPPTFNLSTLRLGTGTTPILATLSDCCSQAYSASQSITNPGTTNDVIELASSAGGTRTVYVNRLVVTCSALCNFSVNYGNGAGATCGTAPTKQILNNLAGTIPKAVVQQNCSVLPTLLAAAYSNLTLAAGIPLILDLQGYEIPSNGSAAIYVIMNTALTGTISATWVWYEN